MYLLFVDYLQSISFTFNNILFIIILICFTLLCGGGCCMKDREYLQNHC